MDAVGGSWAGTFACSACGRKRLTAEAFSANMLRQLREQRISENALKCKECVLAAQAAERESAIKAREGNKSAAGELLPCSFCKKKLLATMFTNTQARKPDTSRKCRDCSASVEAAAVAASSAARETKLKETQEASAAASNLPKGAAGAAARLKAASAECAMEAQKVTGLKPLVGAGSRGRGRGRGSWRARGRR